MLAALYRTATLKENPRGDFSIDGLLRVGERCFVDIRVWNHLAASYADKLIAEIHAIHEQEKNGIYKERIELHENGRFLPAVFSTGGSASPGAELLMRKLAEAAEDRGITSYAHAIARIRTRVTFLLARAASDCIRGTHKKKDTTEGLRLKDPARRRGCPQGKPMHERFDLGADEEFFWLTRVPVEEERPEEDPCMCPAALRDGDHAPESIVLLDTSPIASRVDPLAADEPPASSAPAPVLDVRPSSPAAASVAAGVCPDVLCEADLVSQETARALAVDSPPAPVRLFSVDTGEPPLPSLLPPPSPSSRSPGPSRSSFSSSLPLPGDTRDPSPSSLSSSPRAQHVTDQPPSMRTSYPLLSDPSVYTHHPLPQPAGINEPVGPLGRVNGRDFEGNKEDESLDDLTPTPEDTRDSPPSFLSSSPRAQHVTDQSPSITSFPLLSDPPVYTHHPLPQPAGITEPVGPLGRVNGRDFERNKKGEPHDDLTPTPEWARVMLGQAPTGPPCPPRPALVHQGSTSQPAPVPHCPTTDRAAFCAGNHMHMMYLPASRPVRMSSVPVPVMSGVSPGPARLPTQPGPFSSGGLDAFDGSQSLGDKFTSTVSLSSGRPAAPTVTHAPLDPWSHPEMFPLGRSSSGDKTCKSFRMQPVWNLGLHPASQRR